MEQNGGLSKIGSKERRATIVENSLEVFTVLPRITLDAHLLSHHASNSVLSAFIERNSAFTTLLLHKHHALHAIWSHNRTI